MKDKSNPEYFRDYKTLTFVEGINETRVLSLQSEQIPNLAQWTRVCRTKPQVSYKGFLNHN